MSLKLYHGLRFRTTDLGRITAALNDLRREFRPLMDRDIAATCAEWAVTMLDGAILGRAPKASLEMDVPDPATALTHGEGALREVLVPVVGSELASRLADVACTARHPEVAVVTRRRLDPADRVGSPASVAFMAFLDRQRKLAKERRWDPEIDWECSVVVLPETQGQVLGLLFCERDELTERIHAHPLIEPFPYWNNTDRPRDVTPQEWGARAGLWRAALNTTHDGYEAPSYLGLSVTLTMPEPSPPLRGEELVAALPSFDDRVRSQAKDRVFNPKFQEILRADRERRGVAPDAQLADTRAAWSEAMDAFGATADWLKTADGQAALAAEVSLVSSRLPRDVTKDMLTASLPKVDGLGLYAWAGRGPATREESEVLVPWLVWWDKAGRPAILPPTSDPRWAGALPAFIAAQPAAAVALLEARPDLIAGLQACDVAPLLADTDEVRVAALKLLAHVQAAPAKSASVPPDQPDAEARGRTAGRPRR